MPHNNVAELNDISKLYGTFAALRRVTAAFSAGRCYVILGPNGAGKSTLLRVLAGLLRPSYGTVRVLGIDDLSAVRSRIGYMGHDSMLYDELTVLENLQYTAALYRDAVPLLPPEQALAQVGLDAKLDRPVGKYSQGMRQRAALARILLTQPDLLLLDEPFSNVDAASSAQMLSALTTLRRAGKTILLTTHQPELARPIADFFCTMQDGRIMGLEEIHPGGAAA